MRALDQAVEQIRRAKLEARRRYTATCIHTGETKTLSKAEMDNAMRAEVTRTNFDYWGTNAQAKLFAGEELRIGDVVFQIQMSAA